MSAKQSKPATKKPAPAKKAAAPKAKARARKATTPPDDGLDPEDKPLSQNEELFALAYLAHGLNATRAYMSVHPNAKNSTAKVEGSRTLAKPHVARRVAQLAEEREKELEIEGKELLRHTHAVATADHRHLTEFRYFACRYCYGLDHRRHRTLAEFEDDRREHEKAERMREAQCLVADKVYVPEEFDEEGGPGFNEWEQPAEDCPNCFGHGLGRMVVADTSKLPPDAAILFAGVKESKDGLEVKYHDKMKAVDMLNRHKGLYEADNTQLAAATSPEALEALAASMAEGRAKQLAKLSERRGSGFTGD